MWARPVNYRTYNIVCDPSVCVHPIVIQSSQVRLAQHESDYQSRATLGQKHQRTPWTQVTTQIVFLQGTGELANRISCRLDACPSSAWAGRRAINSTLEWGRISFYCVRSNPLLHFTVPCAYRKIPLSSLHSCSMVSQCNIMRCPESAMALNFLKYVAMP